MWNRDTIGTISSVSYCEYVLLAAEFEIRRLQGLINQETLEGIGPAPHQLTPLYMHDNAPPHKAASTVSAFNARSINIISL